MLLIVALLYVSDWVMYRDAKANLSTGTNSAGLKGATNVMSPTARAGIMTALEHVRYEISHTTNTNDLDTLRAAEMGLTNVLARP